MNLKIRKNNIIKNDTFHYGRYTIVKVEDDKGDIGFGLAIRSKQDKPSKDKGYMIARGRAEKSLTLKKENKFSRSLFVG
jgi:hypothetical protein